MMCHEDGPHPYQATELHNVWYEFNPQSLFHVIQSQESTASYKAQNIFHDIRILMQNIHVHNINLMYKEGNEVANVLAITATRKMLDNFPLDYRRIKSNCPKHILHQVPTELSF